MHKPLLIIAFLGLLVSGYLLITYVSPVPLVCTSGGGCQAVRASDYANILGLPTPAHGVIYYLLLGLGAALWQPSKKQKNLYLALFLLTGIGFAVSVWLTYIEARVIQAWCSWCVVSAILATLAFAIMWVKPRKSLS